MYNGYMYSTCPKHVWVMTMCTDHFIFLCTIVLGACIYIRLSRLPVWYHGTLHRYELYIALNLICVLFDAHLMLPRLPLRPSPQLPLGTGPHHLLPSPATPPLLQAPDAPGMYEVLPIAHVS